MKTNRRGFIGASILAAIPSFGVIGSVFSQEKPLIHKWKNTGRAEEIKELQWVSTVHCETLDDPEISINCWNKPSYKIKASFSDFTVGPLEFPVGNVLKSGVKFLGRDGKECLIVNSGQSNSRTMLAAYCWSTGFDVINGKGGVHNMIKPRIDIWFQFDEVPAVIFEEKRATAEEIYGVADFPSISQ